MDSLKAVGSLECRFVNLPAGREFQPDRLAVFCHGFGAPGSDLVPIGEELLRARPGLEKTVFVFPQGPVELDPHYDSRAWWMIDIERIQKLMMDGKFHELRNDSPPELKTRSQQIVEMIDILRNEFQLSSSQVAIGGFSQGAMLATDVALHHPGPLGGLIVWSGALINESEWQSVAQEQEKLHVVQSHGRFDPLLPFMGAELLQEMLAGNGHEVRFIPFAGEHSIPLNAMNAAAELLEDCLSE